MKSNEILSFKIVLGTLNNQYMETIICDISSKIDEINVMVSERGYQPYSDFEYDIDILKRDIDTLSTMNEVEDDTFDICEDRIETLLKSIQKEVSDVICKLEPGSPGDDFDFDDDEDWDR